MESLFAPAVNVFILVAFLATKLKAPIRSFVAQRHQIIRDEVQAVRDQLRQSQEKYDEFSAKLKAIDSELIILREQTKQDSAAIKQKIINEARRISGSIVSDAKNAADGLFSDLKGQLYGELVTKVVDQAEGILRDRLTGDDRARIRQEFSRQMETIQ